jgi:septal ring factor EnvC (AmiA/AmiB activator)
MATTQTETTFADVAEMQHRLTSDTVTKQRERAAGQSATYAAQWSTRSDVEAETENGLYGLATLENGEARFVDALARLVSNSERSTDAFDQARVEAQRTAALKVLRVMRGYPSTESKLALVDAL